MSRGELQYLPSHLSAIVRRRRGRGKRKRKKKGGKKGKEGNRDSDFLGTD